MRTSRHQTPDPAESVGNLSAPKGFSRAQAVTLDSLSETIERSADKMDRHDAIIKINSFESLQEFCALRGGKERLLQTLEVACTDPFWRVRNYASSTLRLMIDTDLLEPKRILSMIEAGTFFRESRHTAFADLNSDLRFIEDAVPLNREWTARANVRAAGLWAWAEATARYTAPKTGAFGFYKLFPPGSSRNGSYNGSLDPLGLPGKQEIPFLMRQYLTFALNNNCDYTRTRRYLETGIAMLVIGASNSKRALDAAQIDAIFEVLAPRRPQ